MNDLNDIKAVKEKLCRDVSTKNAEYEALHLDLGKKISSLESSSEEFKSKILKLEEDLIASRRKVAELEGSLSGYQGKVETLTLERDVALKEVREGNVVVGATSTYAFRQVISNVLLLNPSLNLRGVFL
jgi:chromosome segregation ATPase